MLNLGEAHPGPVDVYLRAVEPHPGALEDDPGSMEAHPGAIEAHPGPVETLLCNNMTTSSCHSSRDAILVKKA
jgi:hypothetical protein